MDNKSNFFQAKKITLIAIAINITLGILKTGLGFLGQSNALFADGLNSFSDIIIDSFVFIGAKTANVKPDKSHPYGHGRIETIFTIFLACAVIVVAGGITYEALHNLWTHHVERPHIYTLFVAVISVFSNEWFFRITRKVNQKIGSPILEANAWHHRGDAWSSAIVFAGILGALLGFHFLDEIVALFIGIVIFRMGGKMLFSCFRELIDTAIDDQTIEKLQHKIKSMPGVLALHDLRTRTAGGQIFMDLHIEVDPYLTVSEGHFIAGKTEQLLMQEPLIEDVVVHIDLSEKTPESINLNSPDRKTLLQKIELLCKTFPGYNAIKKINFHYVEGLVEVELFFPTTVLTSDIKKSYASVLLTINPIKKVDIYTYDTP